MLAVKVSRIAVWVVAASLVACGRTEPLRPHEDGGAVLTGTPAPTPPDANVVVDGGEPTPVGCVTGHIALTRATPTVMFVLDRSGSMNTNLGNNSRWGSLTNALAATLPPVTLEMQIGALFYPGPGNGRSCSVDNVTTIPPEYGNAGAVIAQMVITRPTGQTPTAEALSQASDLLAGRRAATSARALVLATDGAPNCNASLSTLNCVCANNTTGGGCRGGGEMCLDDVRTVNQIATLRNKGLPTYVIGIQSQNDLVFINTLNAMAIAGGRARSGVGQSYYAANSEAEIETALTTIRNQVGSCVYLTTSVPDARGTIEVTVNGTLIAAHDIDAGVDGWLWGNQPNGEIVISGTACDRVAALSNPTLEALVVCAGADGGS